MVLNIGTLSRMGHLHLAGAVDRYMYRWQGATLAVLSTESGKKSLPLWRKGWRSRLTFSQAALQRNTAWSCCW